MEVTEARIALHVDARRARFPIVVDPLAWFETAEVLAPDPVTEAYFGLPVAISGSFAVIGGPGATVGGNANQGAAYFFAQSEGEVPDLRLAPSPIWSQYENIVLGGALEDAGMASFKDYLTKDDVAAIRAYVLQQAHLAWDQAHAKAKK